MVLLLEEREEKEPQQKIKGKARCRGSTLIGTPKGTFHK